MAAQLCTLTAVTCSRISSHLCPLVASNLFLCGMEVLPKHIGRFRSNHIHLPKKLGTSRGASGVSAKGINDWELRKTSGNTLQMDKHSLNMLAPNPVFAHTQGTHPNNIVYLSSEEKWKHWLYAGILTVAFLGFRVLICGFGVSSLGFWVSGFKGFQFFGPLGF